MNEAVPGPRVLAAAVLACCAAALAALIVPVHLPERDAKEETAIDLSAHAAQTAPEEDLSAFLASRRWGLAIQDIQEADAVGASINPVLAKMGFVGLIVTTDERAVLLQSPDGRVDRLAPGDTLPDGRTLVAITDNDLTLKAEGVPEEVLTLFPPIRQAPPAGDGVDEAGGGATDVGAAAGAAVSTALDSRPGGRETLARSRAADPSDSR